MAKSPQFFRSLFSVPSVASAADLSERRLKSAPAR
jgi:hypothetical protein